MLLVEFGPGSDRRVVEREADHDRVMAAPTYLLQDIRRPLEPDRDCWFMALARRCAGRAVVGDRSAHHQHVGSGQRGEHRAEHLLSRRCLRDRNARRQRNGQLAGDEAHFGAGVDEGAGDFDSHPAGRAIGYHPHRVDRLFGPAGRDNDACAGER